MTELSPVLRYFAYTAAATISGLFYWLAAENFREHKYRFLYALSLSVLLSPFGAWVISTIVRAVQLTRNRGNSDV